MPMMMEARAQAAETKIVPGEQKLQVTLVDGASSCSDARKRPPGLAGRPSIVRRCGRLADGPAANQIHDRQQNDRAEQRIEE